MFHRANKLKFKKGTGIEVTYNDGKVFFYDVSNMFETHKDMEALKDRKLFISGRIDPGGYGIVWTDELDMSSEVPYHEGILIKKGVNVNKGGKIKKLIRDIKLKHQVKKARR